VYPGWKPKGESSVRPFNTGVLDPSSTYIGIELISSLTIPFLAVTVLVSKVVSYSFTSCPLLYFGTASVTMALSTLTGSSISLFIRDIFGGFSGKSFSAFSASSNNLLTRMMSPLLAASCDFLFRYKALVISKPFAAFSLAKT
jgi:hypothetical protein